MIKFSWVQNTVVQLHIKDLSQKKDENVVELSKFWKLAGLKLIWMSNNKIIHLFILLLKL